MKPLYYPTESDYDEITFIWEASVRATHTFLSEDDIAFFKPLVRNDFLKNVNLICIKDENEKIAAFMGVTNDFMEMLFVHPAKRGQGLGKCLILHAIRYLGIKRVDVNEQNEQAVLFYKHIGFVLDSRDEFDGMGKPFPILHMKLSE